MNRKKSNEIHIFLSIISRLYNIKFIYLYMNQITLN